MKVPSYNRDNRKTNRTFEQLPKGNYVCKIMKIDETTTKKGARYLLIYFDIAEGEYKDFYAKKYQEDDRDNKVWSYDAVYWLAIPYDDCPGWMQNKWDTFWANVEDSNNGYVFTGDEKTIKGKTFGGAFKLEQTQGNNGRVYDHTKLDSTYIAQDVRDGKVKYVPKDALIDTNSGSGDASNGNGFEMIPDGLDLKLPF